MPVKRLAKVERKGIIKVFNKDFPPGTPIDVNYNGEHFQLIEGREETVPAGVIEIIRNAVQKVPLRDAHGQILRNSPGYSPGEEGYLQGEIITQEKPRFFMEVVEDPTKKSRGAPTALEKKAREEERRLQSELDKALEKELKEKEEKVKNGTEPEVEEVSTEVEEISTIEEEPEEIIEEISEKDTEEEKKSKFQFFRKKE